MRNAHLHDPGARGLQAYEQFGREERASGLGMNAAQGRSSEELGRAIDVAHRQAEEGAQCEPVGASVGESYRWICPSDAVADHDVGECRVLLGDRLVHAVEEPAQIGHPELSIAVREADELVAGSLETGLQGRTVAAIDLVVDGAHDIRVGGGQPISDLRGAIAAAVVDGNDLEPLGEGRHDGQGLRHQWLDVVGLVVGRKEVGQLGVSHGRVSTAGGHRSTARREPRPEWLSRGLRAA